MFITDYSTYTLKAASNTGTATQEVGIKYSFPLNA